MYVCKMDEKEFFKLYHPQQRGGAVGEDGSVFFKAYGSRQRGHGIGGIFGAIGRRLLPFIGKYVLPHAKTALERVATDVIHNKRNWKDSVKEHGVNALKGVGSSIFTQSGSGVQRKRTAQHGCGFKKRRNLIKKAARLRKRQRGGRLKKKSKKKKLERKETRRKKPRSIFD